MKVNEVFKSIQGEGKYQGYPVLFVRLSGCTRQCKWCDTKYHIKKKEMDRISLCERIVDAETEVTVFTGGEPLLQLNDIKKVRDNIVYQRFHVETNGDLLKNHRALERLVPIFDYVCISPKEEKVAKRIYNLLQDNNHLLNYDIKVVTDLDKVGMDLLPYATMLMPLSTYNRKRDKKIRQRVWNYCIEKGLFYSARLHVEVWKQTMGK